MEMLNKITETQPDAGCAAYTHGLSCKWNYFVWITVAGKKTNLKTFWYS